MTNGGFIFFNNKKDKDKAFHILNQLYCVKKRIFDLKVIRIIQFFIK